MPRKGRKGGKGWSVKKGTNIKGRPTRAATPTISESQHATAETSYVVSQDNGLLDAGVSPVVEQLSSNSRPSSAVEPHPPCEPPIQTINESSETQGAVPSPPISRASPQPTVGGAGTSEPDSVLPPSSALGQHRGRNNGVVAGQRPAADLYTDPAPCCSFWQSPRSSQQKRSRYDFSDDSDQEDEAARQAVIRQMRNVYNRPNVAPVRHEDVEMADEQAFIDTVPLPQIAFRAPDQDDLAALLADFEVDPDMRDGNDLEYVQQHVVVPVVAGQLQVEQPVDQRLSAQRRAAIAFERFHRHRRFYMAATERNVPAFHVGHMDRRCENCGAKFFQSELNTRGQYSKCCRLGRVQLPPLEACPQLLEELFAGRHRLSGQFRRNVLIYNNCFQFASMQANLRTLRGRGPYVYAIQGRLVHHFAPNVNINEPERSRYGAIYFLDPDFAAEQRLDYVGRERVNEDLIRAITNILHQVNPYARQFRHLHDVYQEQLARMAANNEVMPQVYVDLVAQRRDRRNRPFDAPQVQEIAGVFEMNEAVVPRPTLRVFISGHNAGLREIPYVSGLTDPLTFPLLFPSGEPGFELPDEGDHWLTMNKHYAFRIAYRDGFNILERGGKLTQQYIVAAYIRVEGFRLQYLQNHQNQLRVEEYAGLQDYIATRADHAGVPPGQRFILPSSFLGSPRCQYQRFQDALAVVERMGPPDLFITMTCNPNWPEIIENIPAGDYPNNHPTLVNRVFLAKLKQLVMVDIRQEQIFGETIATIYVIEFQKRGLPHAHILVTLREEDKPREAARIDELISSEIPDPAEEPELYAAVGKFMMHGPCGERNPTCICMDGGRCTAGFPKFYSDETIVREGYPVYRRRRNGRKVAVVRNGRDHELENEFVVPHSPYLLLKYQTHINVEACVSIRSVKYLYKYFFKDADQVLVQIVENPNADGGQELHYDEITAFQNSRYMTPPEAAWRLQEHDLHYNTHVVVRLPLHLQDRQQAYFRPGFEEAGLINHENTMLTEWFALNRRDVRARQFLYPQIPEHFTWDKANHRWNWRLRHQLVIGRLFAMSVARGELYYLRVLLLHVRGAESFEDLRTVNGIVWPTFREACQQLQLLADDQEWTRAMTEAAGRQMPSQLRRMFAYILVFCDVERPVELWNEFRNSMTEDFVRRRMTPQEAEMRALQAVRRILTAHGRRLTDFGFDDVPALRQDDDLPGQQPPAEIAQEGDHMLGQLNPGQLHVFNTVMGAIEDDNQRQRLFFMTGRAGTGKTFLYNALISVLLGREIKVAPVAWTGIAASHLRDGRTVHSRFGLPINVLENSRSRLKRESREAMFLIECKLIIWDEVSMTTRLAFNLVDRTLRELTQVDLPFGGKVVLVGGDFRQCLPVVIDGSRASTVEACVKSSLLWPMFQLLELRTNMRLEPNQERFLEFLDRLGNGTLETRQSNNNPVVRIPQECVVSNLDQLIDTTFGEDVGADAALGRAIISPTNASCDEINNLMLNRLPGEGQQFLSADSAVSDDEELIARYPLEFLHSLNPSGYPPHKLLLKTGVVVLLLRNLDITQGLCNGSRLLIHHLGEHILECELIDASGGLTGRVVVIPRIDFLTPTSLLPFSLKRRQFPVRPAYAVTCNKAQGCTLNSVGIYLPTAVFGHGQLYVAFSRARSFDRVKVLVYDQSNQGQQLFEDDDHVYTMNVVYPEVL